MPSGGGCLFASLDQEAGLNSGALVLNVTHPSTAGLVRAWWLAPPPGHRTRRRQPWDQGWLNEVRRTVVSQWLPDCGAQLVLHPFDNAIEEDVSLGAHRVIDRPADPARSYQ